MGAIEQNVRENVTERHTPKLGSSEGGEGVEEGREPDPLAQVPEVEVYGYAWGTKTFYLPSHFGKPSPSQPGGGSFDHVIIADCLWMPSQHTNLVRTVLHYLAAGGCALVIAGFHTGRSVVRHFFDVATGEYKDLALADRNPQPDQQAEDVEDSDLAEVQGKLKAAEIFEINVDGERRPWKPVRAAENKEQAKRWCVVAVLVIR